MPLAKYSQYKEASASSLTQGKVAQYLNKKGSAGFVTVTMASQQPNCWTNQTTRPVWSEAGKALEQAQANLQLVSGKG